MPFRIKDKSERTVWAEFGEGFQIEIRHITQAEFRRMRERSKKRGWDPKTHRQIEDIDTEKFYGEFAEKAVINWSGLTGDLLRKWVDMDEYPEGEVSYTQEKAAALLLGFGRFDEFVTLLCQDLEAAEAGRKAAEAKNSPPSPADNSRSAAAEDLGH